MEVALEALQQLGSVFKPLATPDALADFVDIEAALPEEMPFRDAEMATRMRARGNKVIGGAFSMEKLRERLSSLTTPSFAALLDKLRSRNPAKGDTVVLVSPATSCAVCQGRRLVVDKRPSVPAVYTARGTRTGELYAKECHACGARHGLSFATGGTLIPDSHCQFIRGSLDAPYFQTTSGSNIYSTADLMLRMKVQAVHSHTAFETFCAEYFTLTGDKLPRYAFQSAYLAFALVLMLHEFQLEELACRGTLALSYKQQWWGRSDLDRTLESYFKILSRASTQYYAGQHHLVCRLPGGHEDCIWIIDGHMKVKRLACDNPAAREVDLGEIGTVVLPCDRTPLRKSRFCYECNEGAARGPALWCTPCLPEEEPSADENLHGEPEVLSEESAALSPVVAESESPATCIEAESTGEVALVAFNNSPEDDGDGDGDQAPGDQAPDEDTPLNADAQAAYLVEKLVDKRAATRKNSQETFRKKSVTECLRKKHHEYSVKFVEYDETYWVCQCDINRAALEAGVEPAPGSLVEQEHLERERKREEARERKRDTQEWREKHVEPSAQPPAEASAATPHGPPSANTRHAGTRAAAIKGANSGDFADANRGMKDVGCENLKELQYAGEIKRTTAGVLALVSACGLFLAVDEIHKAESLRGVHAFLYAIIFMHGVKPPSVLAYDDGCHLLRFWQLREATSRFVLWLLSQLQVVVDRFHFRNHVGQFCKKWVDPSKCKALDDSTQTEAAEQSFSWLARSKHMFRGMSQGRFQFMLLHLVHERNQFLMSVPIKRSMSRKKV